jgi:hypothetical protein
MSTRRICLFLLLSFLPLHADPALTGREIIERVAAQDRLLQARRKALDYDLTITREKLDSSRAVISKTVEHQVVIGDRGPGFGTRSAPGAPEDEAKKASREEPFELLTILDHYTYMIEGEETVDGVPCDKIAFTPKPDAPYHNREEKVLNAVSGHIWASQKDYSLVRNEGALMHPVSVAWIFASLTEMEFRFDALTLPDGDQAPAQERYRYLVSTPFFTLHERDTRQMSNYRPAGTEAAKR